MSEQTADRETIAAYDANAGEYAEDWETQPIDDELHALLLEHLVPGSLADIGCGSGRDSAWLQQQGWAVTGYDGSTGLIAEARARHPEVAFELSALPALEGFERFDNVVCETVVMHLPRTAALSGVHRMGELVRPGGRFYLSWRADKDEDWRDGKGRLYSALGFDEVLAELPAFSVRFRSESDSASSGKRVRRLILERL